MEVSSAPVFVKNFAGNEQACVVLEKLWAQRESGQFCDIILHVKGQRFEAHKNVLAACSPYFESILKNHCTNDELLIICQSLQAFQFLLKFVYTGTITIDETNVSELLVLACHFDLAVLKNYCVDYLNECLDMSNCMTVLEMAQEYGLLNLRKHVEEFVLSNIIEINGHIDFLNADFSKIKPFLDGLSAVMPQYLLLDFICKWVLHDIAERTANFRDLLGIVNWQCVESKFLENLIKTSLLFQNDSEYLNILFTCLKEKEVDLDQFQNVFCNFKPSEKLCGSSASKKVSVCSVKEPSETTAGLFKSLLGYSEVMDIENDKVSAVSLSKEDAYKPRPNIATEGNLVVKQEVTVADKIVTPGLQPAVIDEQVLILSETNEPTETVFSEETGLFIEKPRVSQVNELALDAAKSAIKTFVSMPSGNLNVLAEVTEMFSNYNKNNIKLVASTLNNVSKQETIPVEPPSPPMTTSTKTVERPAIHYLTRSAPSNSVKEVSINQTSDKDSENVTEEPDIQVDQIGPLLIPKIEPEFEESDNSSCDLQDIGFGNSINVDQIGDDNEPDISSIVSKNAPKKPVPGKNKCHSLRHLVRLKWKKGIKCNDCSFLAHSSDMMQDHLERDHGVDITQSCDICSFTCRRRREFTNHMKTHFPNAPFNCDHCTYTSEKFHRLLSHRTIHTGCRPFKCVFCGYGAITKSALEYHIRSHTGEKPYECEVCHRRFAKKCTLAQHVHSHDTGRKFACDKCEFTAKYKSQLIIHKRIHRGTVFRCEFEGCNYTTPAKHCFRAHRRMHINERPYLCGTCGKSFIESGMLVRHERVHMDVKLFFHCDQCEYMTRRRDGLKEHVKKYHSENSKIPYKPRKSNSASSANGLSGNARKARPSVKRKTKKPDDALGMTSSEASIINPLSAIEQGSAYLAQEVVLVTGALSEEQDPVTYLQILPSSEYEMVTVEEVTENV